MKKLIYSFFILIYSFLAMADDNVTKVEFLNFIKENNILVGKVMDTSGYVPPIKDIPYVVSYYSDNELTIENFDNIVDTINALRFKDLNITNLPSTLLSILPNLNVLYIENMNFESFPIIDTLKQLSFDNVNFHTIEKDVFENRNLIVLNIRNSHLSYLSNDIVNLTNLRILNLSNNQLTELNSEIDNLLLLEELYLNENLISKLPNEIANLTNLNILDLSKTKINELPLEIENLTNLKDLDLSSNNLEELPNSILKLKLTTLKLANNNLKTLPSDFGNIETLKYLNLSNNQLKYLPDSFLNLKNFAYLYLGSNDLRELPKDFFTIFQNHFVTYNGALWPGAQVDISNNKVSFFDNSICKVNAIYRFNFYNNYLDTFPNCVNNMSASNLWLISSISDYEIGPYDVLTNITNSFDVNMGEFLKKVGWNISEGLVTIDYAFEDNKTIQFKPIYQKDMNITSYLWNFGDGNSSNKESTTHIYLNYGDYNVTLTIDNNITLSKLISVYPKVVELKKGWNLITPPTKNDINASLFETMWSYQNKSWSNNHSYLTPTIGYWVKLNEDLNYSYSGEIYKTPNYKIKDGWNLIGNGEKMINFDENLTYYIFRDNSWSKNPKEVRVGEGVWVKK